MKNAPIQTKDQSAVGSLYFNSNSALMSSLDIAELTGKRHADVLSDTRGMFEKLEISSTEFSAQYKDSTGRSLPLFNLPKDLTLTLVSGYDIPLRYRVVKRVEELESQLRPSINFNDPIAAARAWADTQEALQIVMATKAEIGSRREATAMNTASQAVKKFERLAIELDQSKMYATIKRMGLCYHGIKFDWRKLKATAIEIEIDPIDVFDANYGTVKAYHKEVWKETYGLDIGGHHD